MPVNPKLIDRVAKQIMGLPICGSSDIKMDVMHMTDTIIPFIIPGNPKPVFKIVFNSRGQFIGFDDDKTYRQITVSEDGKLSDADIQWFEAEVAKRNVTLRSMLITLMTSEKNMESVRGVPYYEQFPKFSLRKMLDMPVLLKLVIKNLNAKEEDIPKIKATLQTKSDDYLKKIYSDALSNYFETNGIPVSQEQIDSAFEKNRIEFVKLLQKVIDPFSAVKYIYNKDSAVDNINTDDIVVIDTRTKKHGTIGNPSDPYIKKLLYTPLSQSSELLVDVGYLQNGDHAELFYRVGIADGNVMMVRYTKPDENGKQRLSSVKSKTKLSNFAGLNDWVGSTVSATIEKDNDIENAKPGNLNLFLGNKIAYPDNLSALFYNMRKTNMVHDKSITDFASDYESDSEVKARIVRVPSSLGARAIAFTVSPINTPVVILHLSEIDDYSNNNFINVNNKDDVEIRYMSTFRNRLEYSTMVVHSATEALSIAQNLCTAYGAGFDFIDGLDSMMNELSHSLDKYFDQVNIHTKLDFKPISFGGTLGASCEITVTSDLSASNIMKAQITVLDDNSETHHVQFGYKKKVLNRNFVSINLDGQNINQIMSNPNTEEFDMISEALIPVLTGTEYGTIKHIMSGNKAAGVVSQDADIKRRNQRIVNAGQDVDKSNAMEKLNQCRQAFDNTFLKYGEPYELSENIVNRNQHDNSLISVSFIVDYGTGGAFIAIPHMTNGKNDGNSDVFYEQNQAEIPVTYDQEHANDNEVTFSNQFLNRFFEISGSVQSKIKNHSEEFKRNPV